MHAGAGVRGSTTETGPTESAGAGEFTSQGTELGFGEVATVPFSSNDQTGAIGVTVVDIKAGTEAELAPSGTSVVGTAYTSHEADIDAANTNYDEDPIVWR